MWRADVNPQKATVPMLLPTSIEVSSSIQNRFPVPAHEILLTPIPPDPSPATCAVLQTGWLRYAIDSESPIVSV